jgi:histidyl-tRNA synthetase
MEDVLPADVRLWQWLERKASQEMESCGYCQIRTPMLEETAVFARGIGETTDIVSKEMYTFADRKERSLSLRPEGTAPIVRAYIEHGLSNLSPVHRFYYIGPMFRAERPQKGRSRQFHQIGVEVIGSGSVFADVEVIAQLDSFLKSLGLSGFRIKLNSLGCRDDKSKFADSLGSYLKDKKAMLCEECRARMDRNVLRVLDCKNEACAAVVRGAPNAADGLCEGCSGHFARLKEALTSLGVAFEEAKNLVRGLDYYTGTVFEVTHPALGSQDAIGAGGRYDNLVEDMGGHAAGAVGYALGMERIMIALKNAGVGVKADNVVYVATFDDAAKIEGMRLSALIRGRMPGLVVLQDISGSSAKSQMRAADKAGAKIVLILGEDEVKNGKVTMKMMDNSAPQASVDKGAVIEELRRKIC